MAIGDHAIVIGAGIGGLVIARVLSDHYRRVTVYDRDQLPDEVAQRKYIPHGWHAHGLLARGREALEEMFPGFTKDLVAQGAPFGDVIDDVCWFRGGGFLHQAPSEMKGLLFSRPLVETYLRNRVRALPNVSVVDRHDVCGLIHTGDTNKRVTGVRIQARDGGAEQTIAADLVVDAAGRASRMPAWLAELGYPAAAETEVGVDIGYVSRFYRRKPEHLGGKLGVQIGAAEPHWRSGSAWAQEGDRWIISLGGFLGERASADDAGFLAYAKSLPNSSIYDILTTSEPVSDFAEYTFSSNLRRRYESLDRHPEGLLAVADAICSFNPVYGQGMSVAAVQALALRDAFAQGGVDLARRFYTAVSPLIDIPWQITMSNDFMHPRVQGVRSRKVKFVHWYLKRYFVAAQRDAALALKFLRVANLLEPTSNLLKPGVMLRVWRALRTA